MRNVQAYWQQVNKVRAELELSHPQGIYLSIEPDPTNSMPGGSISLCKPHVAAIRLADQTHKRATQEEIDKYQADQEAERVRLLKIHRADKQTFTTNLEDEELDRLRKQAKEKDEELNRLRRQAGAKNKEQLTTVLDGLLQPVDKSGSGASGGGPGKGTGLDMNDINPKSTPEQKKKQWAHLHKLAQDSGYSK